MRYTDNRIDKQLKNAKYSYIVVQYLLKLDHVFPILYQKHVRFVTERPVIKSYDLVILFNTIFSLLQNFLLINFKLYVRSAYFFYIILL